MILRMRDFDFARISPKFKQLCPKKCLLGDTADPLHPQLLRLCL